MMTYGDGVLRCGFKRPVKVPQRAMARIATMTTVNIAQMKGVLDITPDNVVKSFR